MISLSELKCDNSIFWSILSLSYNVMSFLSYCNLENQWLARYSLFQKIIDDADIVNGWRQGWCQPISLVVFDLCHNYNCLRMVTPMDKCKSLYGPLDFKIISITSWWWLIFFNIKKQDNNSVYYILVETWKKWLNLRRIIKKMFFSIKNINTWWQYCIGT